jgi:hypothetical protein
MSTTVRGAAVAVLASLIGLVTILVPSTSHAAVIATYNLFGVSDGRVMVGLDPSVDFDLSSGTTTANVNAGWMCAHLAPELWKFRYYSNELCITAVQACSEAASRQQLSPGITFTFDSDDKNTYRCWSFRGGSELLTAREVATPYPVDKYPAKTIAVYDHATDPDLQRPTLTTHLEFRDGNNSGDVAEIGSSHFRLHSKDGLIYSIRYLGWDGKPRVAFKNGADFITYSYGFAPGYDRLMQPMSCLAAGVCESSPSLHYIGLDGRQRVATMAG